MLPPQLELEIENLRKDHSIEIVEESTIINVVIDNLPTSDLYSLPIVTVLLRVPRAYPDAGLDMFWTTKDHTLKGVGIPNGANQIEKYLEKEWRRFSWHPNPGNPKRWNPTVDNLLSYLEFVKRRFEQG